MDNGWNYRKEHFMPLNKINMRLEKKRGYATGYPKDLRYIVTEKSDGTFELRVEGVGKGTGMWKKADPWGFAVFDEIRDEVRQELNSPLVGLRFVMPVPTNKNRPQYEALKRRLWYLADANKNISIALSIGGQDEPFKLISELYHRPENEVIRQRYKDRGDKDKPGRLEKDFQTYLFGKGQHEDNKEKIRTNERLALFGEDFSFIKNRKKSVGVDREFPTGVFDGEMTNATRILPTEFVDLVTINKHNEIAIIELKFDDAKLEVIAQLLNYAIFFHSYKAKLMPQLDERLHCSSADRSIKAYLVSNVFHQRFEAVWRYYSRGAIRMRQVMMGYMPEGE